jgi:hypothetical protein
VLDFFVYTTALITSCAFDNVAMDAFDLVAANGQRLTDCAGAVEVFLALTQIAPALLPQASFIIRGVALDS